MIRYPRFKKTIVCSVVCSLIGSQAAMAAPLPFATMPAGHNDRTPAPNVIISVDDSGSMWGTKMTTLKSALTSVFNDMTLLPDGKIRLAWQVMWNNGSSPGANTIAAGAVNSMKVLDSTHRANFQSFVDSLSAGGMTPSMRMMRQADEYMRLPQSINSPWASKPGVQETPYLSCRRSYHIFMTDGRWNSVAHPDIAIGNVDGTDTGLPDGNSYTAFATQTKIYGDTYDTPNTTSEPRRTLADWAFRSWSNDLQTGIDNEIQPTVDYLNAPPTETIGGVSFDKYWNPKYNPATWQHMVTYSIGYGVEPGAWSSTLGIARPTDTLPFGWNNGFVSLMTGAKTWPDLSPNETNRSLDLWHAAINGRGRYFWVQADYQLRVAFESILQRINDETSSSVSGVAASASANVVENVGIYTAGYDASKAWSGYVYADTFGTNGALSKDPTWGPGAGTLPPSDHHTTADKLDALTAADINNRFILTSNDTTQTGVPFRWATDESNMSNGQKAALNRMDSLGEDRVNFLRGDRTKEAAAGGTFRDRQSRQGDIINSSIWYVGAPANNMSRLGYSEFRNSHKDRLPMIYVGGNDGMLHGFSAENGQEKIAYVPKAVIPKLHELTDPAYSHKYYVDATPFTGDVNLNESAATAATTDWRTMLVGALGAGGRGYFVLDVTKPGGSVANRFVETNAASLVIADRTLDSAASPVSTSDEADMGHIFAAPVVSDVNPFVATQITRMNDGRWAVVLGNGYNSVNERPVLLIQYLDGARELKKIVATGATAPLSNAETTGNGLSAPRVVDINGDGTADVVYAGDLKGNLWKFDVSSASSGDWQVAFGGQPLYTAIHGPVATGRRQPITAPPTVKPNDRGVGGMMVAFGTGRHLTVDDRANGDQQTIYSVLDNTRYQARNAPDSDKIQVHPGGGTCPGVTCIPAPAALGSGVALLQEQTVGATSAGSGSSTGKTFNNVSANAVDWSTQRGWYLNLPEGRERLLKAMPFYDSSNLLSVFTQVPATGTSSIDVEEACVAPVTQERQYLTLLNIMDGKPPSIPVMDRNGDAFFNAADGGVSRVTLNAGATSVVTNLKTVTVFSGGAHNSSTVMRAMPETPVRPSWRQLQ